MKQSFLCLFIFTSFQLCGQELYVFSEPASNMPARSISAKLTAHLVSRDRIYGRFSQRYMPQLMFGINKKLMLHLGATLSDMHTLSFRYESFNVYAKYRVLSNDDIHTHFRMAVFAEGSKTKAPFHYDEITLMGDKSGVGAGIIATQLWNKLALSGMISHYQVLDKSRHDKVLYIPERGYEAMAYSISAGYLLIPREYSDYHQTNVNLYAEFLAEQGLDVSKYYIDAAPAIQFIFNSNTKINIGYRFQIAGTMQRMSSNSWQISLERTFLNAFGN